VTVTVGRHSGDHQASREETTMQSNNPVFRNSDEFKPGYNAYGNATYGGNGQAYPGYGQAPQAPQAGYGQVQTGPTYGQDVDTRPMTVDSVVQKTAITLGVLIVAAIVTWAVTPDLRDPNVNIGPIGAALAIGGILAFILSMANSFMKRINPAMVLLFAAAEGVALGAFSKLIDATYSTSGSGSLVVQAVIGTFAALAGTLAAYKFLHVRVGARTQRVVFAVMYGMVALAAMELLLGIFGHSLGLFGITGLGMVTAVLGLALGIFMLLMDFQYVEYGVANRIPDRESWRAAFALTVSLVWIYQNLLRILAFFSNNR
jgi:uncharacterized YccA/Bax inhibitor family protein